MRALNRVPARHVIASARLRGHGHRLCRPRGAVRVRDGAIVRWTAAALLAGLVVFEVTSALHVLTVLLGAVALHRRAAWLAWLGALAATGYAASGVLIAAGGFSGTQQSIGFAAQIALAVWLVATALLAWRRAF